MKKNTILIYLRTFEINFLTRHKLKRFLTLIKIKSYLMGFGFWGFGFWGFGVSGVQGFRGSGVPCQFIRKVFVSMCLFNIIE